MEECVIKVSDLPSNLFFYAQLTDWLTDWLTWPKTQHLAKGDGLSWKGSPGRLRGAKHWKFSLPPTPPNNIFIITVLHLLPLLQISCWKKWTHTKDPGESWDSALIGKPFNILKYNLTFLSIEEPPRGRVAEGEYALFSRKPFSSYKQTGAFPGVYIVLAYLGAGRNPADSRHCNETGAQSTTPLENPKRWVMV